MARRSSKKREEAAYHEAGHAVMCWAQRRAFQTVTIIGGKDSDGSVRCQQPGEWFKPEVRMDGRTRRRVEQEIQVAWAGALAQEIREGLGSDTCYLPVGGDFEAIVWFAGCAVGSENLDQIQDYSEQLRLRARDTLLQPQNWRAVEALTQALLERGTLKWPEAREFMKTVAAQEPDSSSATDRSTP